MKITQLEKLAGEYEDTYNALSIIECKLTKEIQKYITWDKIQVSITGVGEYIVRAQGEADAAVLSEIIEHIKEHGAVSDTAYGHLAYV